MIPAGSWHREVGSRSKYRDGPFGLRFYTIVYAIDAPGHGRIKFGRTLDVQKRFSQLCSTSPVPLELLGFAWLPHDAEADIHAYLADDRSHGEWFLRTERTRAIAALIAAQEFRMLAEEVGINGYQYAARISNDGFRREAVE